MTGMTAQTPSDDDRTGLPRPRQGARWRWSLPGRALAAGGALAAVLGLGVTTGAGAATTTGQTGAAARGRPPGAMARPTVSGTITALNGDDVTVVTTAKSAVTVVTTSSTSVITNPGPGGGTTSGASALKVGGFIGVTGTRDGDGTLTAKTITIGRPPRMGRGSAGHRPGTGGRAPSASGAGAPGA
ncbi:MAG TPA: hypothetical protein VHX67_12370 [Acidimicrobiales bacterium]|nr:hypothetical protein [Acidimicrobiales bacterium]